ncbi:hypothetical protein [uncultured Sphingomonas sp.]|uniref:hypothetical protein n=1 Tax=uncultured Sphingomonas sp. TaxID=158754 RepID=UPI0025F83DFB|nr:hypothetical protein [uncultured Sphingomonas sp.]
MKHDFEWPVVPHPITALDLDAIGSSAFYVDVNGAWVLATYEAGYWRSVEIDGKVDRVKLHPQPRLFLTPTDDADWRATCAEPRTGWNCGNRGLQARYILLLIERNPHMTVKQLERLHNTIDAAGPEFTQQRLNFFTAPLDEEVPF